jgi:hypothetical protein
LSFVSGILRDVIEYVRQNEIEKAQEILDAKISEFYSREAKENRIKQTEIISSIVQIDMEMKKIEIQYKLIQNEIPAALLKSIDQYIYELKKKRKELEMLKKRIK